MPKRSANVSTSPPTTTKRVKQKHPAIKFTKVYKLLVAYYSAWICRIYRARLKGMKNQAWDLADTAYRCCLNYEHKTVTWSQYLSCEGVTPAAKEELLFLMSCVIVDQMSPMEQNTKIESLRSKNGGKVLSLPTRPGSVL